MSLDQALKFLSDHQAALIACAYAMLNIANALLKGPEAQSILAKLADVLAILTRKDAAGTLKLPGMKSKSDPRTLPLEGKGPSAVLSLILASLTALPGCAFCKDAANAAAPRCVLEQNMVKCGESSGFALLPVVLGLIANAVAGQPFDPKVLESDLISQGVRDVPCVLAALEDYIMGSALAKAGDPASLLLAMQIHAALLDSLTKKGMHGHLTLHLRAGHVVEAEVP